MIQREMEGEARGALKEYPVLTVIGPRQAGKTTLVQKVFPKFSYVNLENPETREFARSDANGFLRRNPAPLIIDEVQRLPQLLSNIQVAVDKSKKNGQYVLTGSHQLELQAAVTQSLAGRTALLKLLPLSIGELTHHGISMGADDYVYQGFLPRVYDQEQNPTKAYRNYFETYVERDLKSLVQVKDVAAFERFLRLCAGRIGQLLNVNSLANDTGVSHSTVEHWLSMLEASFVITRLQPFFENIGKRLVKAPKLYFNEVGLATYLLGIEDRKQVHRDPLYGNLMENLVVLDLMKYRLNQGLNPNLYFIRDSNGREIDLIYKDGRELVPIEIKGAETFQMGFLSRLHLFQKWVGKKMTRGFLIYAGETEQKIQNIEILNFKNATKIMA